MHKEREDIRLCGPLEVLRVLLINRRTETPETALCWHMYLQGQKSVCMCRGEIPLSGACY